MLNKIKVVTFLLALVIGTFLFLDKAYAQFGFVGHPVCPADNCVADLLDCNCEQECIFGMGGEISTGSQCQETLGFLDCQRNVTPMCKAQFQGAEFGNCVMDELDICTQRLSVCISGCS